MYYGGYYNGRSLYFAFNFHWDSHEFYLPDVSESKNWKVILNTAGEQEDEVAAGFYRMAPRSIAVLENVREEKKEIPAHPRGKRIRKYLPERYKQIT